jgi:hypothetical protein
MRLNWRRSLRAEDQSEEWVLSGIKRKCRPARQLHRVPYPDEGFPPRTGAETESDRVVRSENRSHRELPRHMSRLLGLRQKVRSPEARAGGRDGHLSGCHRRDRFDCSLWVPNRTPGDQHGCGCPNCKSLGWRSLRGTQPGALQSVSLPAAKVRVTVILPRFSSPSQYLVAVART